jgi:hypothetical protein
MIELMAEELSQAGLRVVEVTKSIYDLLVQFN